MYTTYKTLQPAAAIFISVIVLLGFAIGAPAAEARTSIADRIEARICPQLERAIARLPVSVPLPGLCTTTPPPVQPTVDINVDPTSIVSGGTATLSWNSTNADSCTASNGWTGSKATSGSGVSVNPTVTTTYTLTCTNANGSAHDSATLTVTAAPSAPTLTLEKTVTNNSGGTATAANFQAKIDGTNVAWSVAQTVTVGAHTASETGVGGYTASVWGGDCAADGSVTLAAGENKTCTITNDDQPGTLVIKKVLIQDNGRTEATTTFSFQVNAGTATAFEADGENSMTVNAGTYDVTEVAATGYTTTYNNCTDVVVSIGETETCTITNNDIAPAPVGALLITEVLYDIGTDQGTETNDEWVEIHNGTNAELDLSGYALKDNNGTVGDVFPAGTLVPAGGFLIVVGTSTTPGLWAFPVGTVVFATLDGDIGGNGLSNTGDIVALYDSADILVDRVSWGTNIDAFSPSVHPSPTADDFPGSSIARTPMTTDTNTAADWVEDATPTPGL